MTTSLQGKKVSLHTLGCKVNSYETEAIKSRLADAGCQIVPFTDKADIVIINTCTVTAVADKKSRQMLHRARTQNPDAVVVAMGCYAETGREILMKDIAADILIGNNRKNEIVPILKDWFAGCQESLWYDNIAAKGICYEEMGTDGSYQESRTRAFIKIQDGCDRFCSYCIIPYARGRIRSRKSSDVIEEIKNYADTGFQEVVLTGIHVSSYGRDEGAGCSLITLTEQIQKIEGIKRIRLSSLEPSVIDAASAKRLSALDKLCPHFHLSLQSGCDATLKRMNRSYTAAQYKEKCEILREYFDRPALTTDVIAGFPGETPEDFEESYEFVKSIGFFETHIFPYSRRAGTAADKMPGQLPERIKKERAARLLTLNDLQRSRFLKQFSGEDREVLFEEPQEKDGRLYWCGHTARYEKIFFESEENLRGRIRTVPYEKCIYEL